MYETYMDWWHQFIAYARLVNILGLIKEYLYYFSSLFFLSFWFFFWFWNFLFILISNTYLFIGCLFTKVNLNVDDWTSIFDIIKYDFIFNSVSCENETSLVSNLNKNNIIVYGDQPHYVRAISKALSNKIRK